MAIDVEHGASTDTERVEPERSHQRTVHAVTELGADELRARWKALAVKSQRDAFTFCFPTCLWAFVAWRFATGWVAVGLSVFAGLCLYRVIRKLEEARFARAASRMDNVFETLSPP